jgi:hypothetical protein
MPSVEPMAGVMSGQGLPRSLRAPHILVKALPLSELASVAMDAGSGGVRRLRYVQRSHLQCHILPEQLPKPVFE